VEKRSKNDKNSEEMSVLFQSSLQPATSLRYLNLKAELQQKSFLNSVT